MHLQQSLGRPSSIWPHPTGACLVNIQDNQHGLHSLPLSQSVTQHLPSYVRAGTYSTLLSCRSKLISNFSSQIILLYCLWLLYWSGNDTITSFFSTLPHLLLAVFPSPFSSWGFLVYFVFPASIHAKFLSFTTEWSILSFFFVSSKIQHFHFLSLRIIFFSLSFRSKL